MLAYIVQLLHSTRMCRHDVEVITANPKTAGVARWNFLALWGHLMAKGDAVAQQFVLDVSLIFVSTALPKRLR